MHNGQNIFNLEVVLCHVQCKVLIEQLPNAISGILFSGIWSWHQWVLSSHCFENIVLLNSLPSDTIQYPGRTESSTTLPQKPQCSNNSTFLWKTVICIQVLKSLFVKQSCKPMWKRYNFHSFCPFLTHLTYLMLFCNCCFPAFIVLFLSLQKWWLEVSQYHVHNSLSPVPILSQMKPVHILLLPGWEAGYAITG